MLIRDAPQFASDELTITGEESGYSACDTAGLSVQLFADIKRCKKRNPCPLHEQWDKLCDQLKITPITDVLDAGRLSNNVLPNTAKRPGLPCA
jgi:hypothetical protein